MVDEACVMWKRREQNTSSAPTEACDPNICHQEAASMLQTGCSTNLQETKGATLESCISLQSIVGLRREAGDRRLQRRFAGKTRRIKTCCLHLHVCSWLSNLCMHLVVQQSASFDYLTALCIRPFCPTCPTIGPTIVYPCGKRAAAQFTPGAFADAISIHDEVLWSCGASSRSWIVFVSRVHHRHHPPKPCDCSEHVLGEVPVVKRWIFRIPKQ